MWEAWEVRLVPGTGVTADGWPAGLQGSEHFPCRTVAGSNRATHLAHRVNLGGWNTHVRGGAEPWGGPEDLRLMMSHEDAA